MSQPLLDHLVGTWVGTSISGVDDLPVKSALRIVITRTKKPDTLQMDYTLSGSQGTFTNTRFFSVDAAHGTVVWDFPKDEKQAYQAVGFAEALRTGYGSISFLRTKPAEVKRLVHRIPFNVQPNKLTYSYEKSVDGQPFQTITSVELDRRLDR